MTEDFGREEPGCHGGYETMTLRWVGEAQEEETHGSLDEAIME